MGRREKAIVKKMQNSNTREITKGKEVKEK
jgi:hypothetical protein